MTYLRMKKKDSQTYILNKIELADNFFTRLMGLMFVTKEEFVDRQALLISPCNSIHTFFMKFSLDVYFLDKNDSVIKIYQNYRPWKMTPIFFRSRKVLEIPHQDLALDIKVGDKLEFECTS